MRLIKVTAVKASDEIVKKLNLEPHPIEGGYFAETYRSAVSIPVNCLPAGYSGARRITTAIYYLITPDSFSRMHRLNSDEIFHFYCGDPVEMLQLMPGGSSKILKLGNDIINGVYPQIVVPRGVWQGARLCLGGKYALMGTTVSPGFDYSDYEIGKRDFLIKEYPEDRSRIIDFTIENA